MRRGEAIIQRLAALLVLWLGPTAPAFAADSDWSGSWDTRWPEGAARVELRQHGTDVEGAYRLYDGRVVGKASGDRLEAAWIEGDRRGHFVFVLGPLGQAFTRRFDDGDWWTGQRASGWDP